MEPELYHHCLYMEVGDIRGFDLDDIGGLGPENDIE